MTYSGFYIEILNIGISAYYLCGSMQAITMTMQCDDVQV